jgi:hypothetical protein
LLGPIDLDLPPNHSLLLSVPIIAQWSSTNFEAFFLLFSSVLIHEAFKQHNAIKKKPKKEERERNQFGTVEPESRMKQ